VLFDNFDTAKMHGLDTSNVSTRVESSQVEFGLEEAHNRADAGRPMIQQMKMAR